MKKTKKLLALGLICAMTASILAGCSGGGDKKAGTDTTGDSTPAAEDTQEPAGDAEVPDEGGGRRRSGTGGYRRRLYTEKRNLIL